MPAPTRSTSNIESLTEEPQWATGWVRMVAGAADMGLGVFTGWFRIFVSSEGERGVGFGPNQNHPNEAYLLCSFSNVTRLELIEQPTNDDDIRELANLPSWPEPVEDPVISEFADLMRTFGSQLSRWTPRF